MLILGFWDGHDSGACIVEDGIVKVAINEERLTRRKLEIHFPSNSIKACLSYMNLKPSNIDVIATTTSDFSKTLTRIFPSIKENYYLITRRNVEKPRFFSLKKKLKYAVTERGNLRGLSNRISSYLLRKRLKILGFEKQKLYIVDHHLAHAASAIYTSGMKKCLCITLDGVGDGLSGSISVFDGNTIERLSSIPAKDSLGTFYEQITTHLGMRELEDEGKVMCMADYSYPIEDTKNPMINFFEVKGLKIIAKHDTLKRYSLIEKLAWKYPREQLAYMAQRVLEKNCVMLFDNAIEETGLRNVCWAGGVASNIKTNMKIRQSLKIRDWFVFPNMSDGGLAVGAALYISSQIAGTKPYALDNVYLGQNYSDDEIKNQLKNAKLDYEYRKDIAEVAAELVLNNNFVLWFQGRMEFGPRALGNRSIIAPSSSEEVKEKLNLIIKRREWYQPFCPTVLEEDAKNLFGNVDKYDKFMTMGYMTRRGMIEKLKAVISVDLSSRPQMLGDENGMFRKLLKTVKKGFGYGAVLNTSFNIHGYPIVNTPKEAIEVMKATKSRFLCLGNYFVELKK
ncbi:MAG: hypothetical protein HY361_02655 [Candidatus Aenigmarchaeota archaeon]|nr:hypothetical protein [Candidatus Aenigmarchaeota archaeon]